MAKILIVTDQSELRELIGVVLKITAHQVIEAIGGQLALDLAQLERPDCIILDITAPGGSMTILEIVDRLRRNPHMAGMKIVLLANPTQEQDIQAVLAAGADDYLVKPAGPMAILKKIEETL